MHMSVSEKTRRIAGGVVWVLTSFLKPLYSSTLLVVATFMTLMTSKISLEWKTGNVLTKTSS